jgi:anti-sigma B factor antagonist
MTRLGGVEVHAVATEDLVTLVLEGELDSVSSSLFDRAVAELVAAGTSNLTLDLGGLSFIDSSGMRSVLLAQELCHDRGCGFSVSSVSRQVGRLFELTGVLDTLGLRAQGPAFVSTVP